MIRTEDDWIREYQAKDALWIHDGNPKHPHALLTSGSHSNGFFNSRLVTPDAKLLREAAQDLAEIFVANHGNTGLIEGVVGPQTGATKLAEFISDEVKSITGDECFFASPAKAGEGTDKYMIFNPKEADLLQDKSVLLCEDVLTTGGSIDLAVTAIENAGGIVLPYILVLVNRSGFEGVDDKRIIALIDRLMPMWMPKECPLCKEGSEAIRPKENWNRLNAIY